MARAGSGQRAMRGEGPRCPSSHLLQALSPPREVTPAPLPFRSPCRARILPHYQHQVSQALSWARGAHTPFSSHLKSTPSRKPSLTTSLGP